MRSRQHQWGLQTPLPRGHRAIPGMRSVPGARGVGKDRDTESCFSLVGRFPSPSRLSAIPWCYPYSLRGNRRVSTDHFRYPKERNPSGLGKRATQQAGPVVGSSDDRSLGTASKTQRERGREVSGEPCFRLFPLFKYKSEITTGRRNIN